MKRRPSPWALVLRAAAILPAGVLVVPILALGAALIVAGAGVAWMANALASKAIALDDRIAGKRAPEPPRASVTPIWHARSGDHVHNMVQPPWPRHPDDAA